MDNLGIDRLGDRRPKAFLLCQIGYPLKKRRFAFTIKDRQVFCFFEIGHLPGTLKTASEQGNELFVDQIDLAAQSCDFIHIQQ